MRVGLRFCYTLNVDESFTKMQHETFMRFRYITSFLATIILLAGCSLYTGCSPKPAVTDGTAEGGDVADEKSKSASSPFENLGPGNGLADQARQELAVVIETEDLGLDFSVRIKELIPWLEAESKSPTGELPDELKAFESATLFADADPLSCLEPIDPLTKVGHLPIQATSDVTEVNPLEVITSMGIPWETMQLGIIASRFESNDDGTLNRNKLSLETKMEARATHPDGRAFAFKAYQDLVWEKAGDAWRLVQWHQKDGKLTESPTPAFTEVLAEVIVGDSKQETIARSQESLKDEILLNGSLAGDVTIPVPEFKPWFNATSNHIFTSVSVVDYNNDGHDDIFMTGRWGATQLLQSQGDGTFIESAKEAGLYFERLVNCSLFADLDNDGDKDAIIGRPVLPSMILRNDDGKFVDITDSHTNLGKLYLVSGISVSDVNRDGLLDVYFSTYGPLKDDQAWSKAFLGDDEFTRYMILTRNSHHWLTLPGPPNVMLMNRGDGKLERVSADQEVSRWRRSYQSAWCDYDSDGDDDLYICNDFAPDTLLRNETAKGAAAPKFAEVTDEVIVNKDFGLGMGGSWGDFDRDGDLDLYVSNMFSKAGSRIVKQIGQVDERLKISATGNYLFENEDGSLIQRAGQGDDQYHINQVGWSYGGQWADFDNDGQLDLYVPSGYYSAPKEISTKVDT